MASSNQNFLNYKKIHTKYLFVEFCILRHISCIVIYNICYCRPAAVAITYANASEVEIKPRAVPAVEFAFLLRKACRKKSCEDRPEFRSPKKLKAIALSRRLARNLSFRSSAISLPDKRTYRETHREIVRNTWIRNWLKIQIFGPRRARKVAGIIITFIIL